MQTPSEEAHSAALGILGYLKRTSTMGVTYGNDPTLYMASDSSFGRSPKPMAGHAVFYGGAALSWQAKALKIVPLSSAEAETNVLSMGAKDLMYTKMLLSELRPGKIAENVMTYSDNTAAIDIVKAQGLTAKSKHFERWAAYVRDLFQRHIIGVEYVNTDDMPADIFTKPLPFDTFVKHRATLLNA